MAHGVDAERQLGMVRREGPSSPGASPTNGRRPDRAEENKQAAGRSGIRCSFYHKQRQGWPVSPCCTCSTR